MTILNPPTPGRPDHPDFKRLDDAVKTQDMWHPRRGHDESGPHSRPPGPMTSSRQAHQFHWNPPRSGRCRPAPAPVAR